MDLNSYEELEIRLGHLFVEKQLLVEALTHRSYAHEHQDHGFDNERLELLGDAVLDLAVAHWLMEAHPDWDEGKVSAARSQLVNEQSLAEMAIALDLGAWLRLGKGEDASGGRKKISLLSNCYEAVVGALYQDAGFEQARAILRESWMLRLHPSSLNGFADHKSALQERLQSEFRLVPKYEVILQEGPPHERIFLVRVSLTNLLLGEGRGRSKREAEQKAAEAALLAFGLSRKDFGSDKILL